MTGKIPMFHAQTSSETNFQGFQGWPKPVLKHHGLATVQVLLQQNGAIHGSLSTDTLASNVFPHQNGGWIIGK